MKNPFLIGKNIYLSPLTTEDITEEYVSWLNDADVCKGNSHATFPNNYTKTLAYVESIQDNKTELVFSIKGKKNNVAIGNASLQHINWVNRSGEIAMIIGNKKFWNKGIGEEVMGLLIEYGFNTLNLNRISCGTPVTNMGGIRICEKNGMINEGCMREAMFKNGVYPDVMIYSILKKDYKKKLKNK
jgi:RimJ/RimL family protein N-acetyltransferase